MSDFYLKVGDRLPKIRSILKDGTGAVIDLTHATVTFKMGLGSPQLKVDGPANVVDAINGVVEYVWIAGDTDTPGNYGAEWVVSIGGLTQTVPNRGCLHVSIVERCSV